MVFPARIICLLVIPEMLLVHGEMRFVCPRPQTPESSASQSPCGTNGFKKDFGMDYIVVRPGPFTIQMEETVFRKGTPSRISLMEWGSEGPPCVLLNHIPHNDAVTINPRPADCQTDDYPIGRCSSSIYITVNIPDVECERCYLQLMTVSTLPQSTENLPCYIDGKSSNCSSNYSCANIKIIPTDAGRGLGLDSCQDYTGNLAGRWPFAQKWTFQASLGGSEYSGGHARFEMDHTNFLKYDISLGNVIPIPSRDEIFIVLKSGDSYQRLQYIPVTGQQLTGEFGSFDSVLKSFLQTNQLALELKRSAQQSLYRQITVGPQGKPDLFINRVIGPRVNAKIPNYSRIFHLYDDDQFIFLVEKSRVPDETTDLLRKFRPKYFTHHSMPYSPSGWLTGPDFVGPEAPHPQAVSPSGVCAPTPPQYAAILLDNTDTVLALVTYGLISGERLYLDGMVISPTGSALNISFFKEGDQLLAGFEGEYITRNSAHGTIALLHDGAPTNVSAFVMVNSSYTFVSSEPFRAVKVLLRDTDDRHTALGVLRILETGDLEVTVAIINKTSERTVEAEVLIKGPQPMDKSTEPFAVSVPRTEAADIGGWVGRTVISVKDSFLPHCLWLGSISLHVTFPALPPMTNQFDLITNWLCAESDANVCRTFPFSSEGGKIDMGLAAVEANGIVTVYMVTDTNLQYTITVRDLRDTEDVTSVVLESDSRELKKISSQEFTSKEHAGKAVTTQGSISLSDEDVDDLAAGQLRVVVSTSRSPDGTIYGAFPKIGQPRLRTSASGQEAVKDERGAAPRARMSSIPVLAVAVGVLVYV